MAKATSKDCEHPVASDTAEYRLLRPVLLHYAIARYGCKGMMLLHMPLRLGKEALVLFSSWEAAQNFSLSNVFSEDWYARECSAGELASLLLGPYEGIGWILFDPPLGMHLGDSDTRANLVRRKRFVNHLLG
jgi:hypothetical protein